MTMLGPRALQVAEDAGAVPVRQPVVEEHALDDGAGREGERFLRRRGEADVPAVAGLLERAAQVQADVGVVVNDEDGHGGPGGGPERRRKQPQGAPDRRPMSAWQWAV